jgi:PEGA domain
MQGLLRLGIAWAIASAILGIAAPASANPQGDRAYNEAKKLKDDGDYDKARAKAAEGLLADADHLKLLSLNGDVLIDLHEYEAARAAYQAALDAGAQGALRRHAQNQIKKVTPALSTFLEISASNGPATVYLDRKSSGVYCTAAPSCRKGEFPGPRKVIAERPGFERWSGQVDLKAGTTTKLEITLVELESELTVRVAQEGATITIDDQPYSGKMKVSAGSHRVVVKAPGHAESKADITAHEGKPVDLDVALTPLVPVTLEPAVATLELDGKAITLIDGGLVIPSGARVLVARAPGYRDRSVTIPQQRPADYKVELRLAAIPPPPPPTPASPLFTPRRKIALAAGGVGVVAFATGAILGLKASSLADDALTLCPMPTDCATPKDANDLNQRARSRATLANVSYGVAAAAAVGAAVLWFTGGPPSAESGERPVARVSVTPRLGGSAGVDVSVRF